MIKHLRFSILAFLSLTSLGVAAQFPYQENFRGASVFSVEFGGVPTPALLTAALPPSDPAYRPPGDGALRLTSSDPNQKGYVVGKVAFPSQLGFHIDVEYFIYNGTGAGADGISFFLFDALANPFVIGGFGGSLGYAPKLENNTPPVVAGATLGYVGVGIDEYGNFSTSDEGRSGGDPPGALKPGSVTVRGKGNGNAIVDNYKFLASVRPSTDLPPADRFNLVPAPLFARVTSSTDPNYRRAIVDMAPRMTGQTVTGYTIRVSIVRGSNPPVEIMNTAYNELPPTMLRYAIASSTGDSWNTHEIRNFSIGTSTPPQPAAAGAKTQAGCFLNPVVMNILDVISTPNPGGKILAPAPAPSSFDFNGVDLDVLTTGLQNTITNSFGTFTATMDGKVTFVKASGFTGSSATLNYTVTDNYGGISPQATLTFSDLPPLTTGVSAGTNRPVPDETTNSNGEINNTSEAYAADPATVNFSRRMDAQLPAGATGTWSQESGPAGAPAVVFADRNSPTTKVSNLRYGAYQFRWSVVSAAGSCPSSSLVNYFINGRPRAEDDTFPVSSVTTTRLAVLANDKDNNGAETINKSTVVIVTPPAHGQASVDNDGTVTFLPTAGYSGPDGFTYRVMDVLTGLSNIGIVNITVSVRPTGGVADLIETFTNVAASKNPVDNDGAQPAGTTIVIKDAPTHGTPVLTGRVITYTPNLNYHGRDQLTYVLVNQYGLESDKIFVDITVRPTGDPDQQTVTQGTTGSIDVKANDPGGVGSNVVIVTQPQFGNLVVTAGLVTYTPAATNPGMETFTYKLVDAANLESTPITVTVRVKPVGADDLNNVTNINVSKIIAVKSNDPSQTNTNVAIKTAPTRPGAQATVNTADNTITYTPPNGFSGDDTFTYILQNSSNIDSDPITVRVSVRDLLTAVPITRTTNFRTPITIDAKAANPTVTNPTILLQTNTPSTAGNVVQNADGTLTFTPAANFFGRTSFNYSIRNENGQESEITPITIFVRPAGQNDLYVVEQGSTADYPIKLNDYQAQAGTTLTKQTGPQVQGATATVNSNETLRYSASPDYAGKDFVTYILTTTTDNLTSEPVTVEFQIKPKGTNDFAIGLMNTSILVPVKANDVNPSALTIIKKTNPAVGDVQVGANDVTYLPPTDFHGTATFTYALRTPDGIESDPITVTVQVRPTGTTDIVTAPINAPAVIRVKDNDPGKTGTTIVSITPPAHGTTVLNPDGTITYTPAAGYLGPDTFSYKLRNADGLESDPIIVNLEIRNLPVSTPDVAPAVVGQPVKIPVLTNDTPTGGPIDPKTVVITRQPTNGTVTVDPVTGEVTYTPNPGYTGPDFFEYTVKDNRGVESRPARVSLTVTAAKIGLAKKLVSVTPAINGSYDIKYLFTIVNYTGVPLSGVSLKDDLLTVFSGTIVTVKALTHQGPLRVNPAFNGTSNIELLVPAQSTIAALGEEQVELTLNVKLVSRQGTFNNSALVQATPNGGGSSVTDQSTDGLKPDPASPGDVSLNALTPIELKISPLFIPEGFSPNGDGINDYFVIQNTLDKPVSLEFYNRWNNLVYKSSNYQNDWDGKATQGIIVGEYVPAGTYWYIIKIDDVKYQGFITLNR